MLVVKKSIQTLIKLKYLLDVLPFQFPTISFCIYLVTFYGFGRVQNPKKWVISFDTCLFKMLRSIRKKPQRWAINDMTYFCSCKTMGMMFVERECVCVCTYTEMHTYTHAYIKYLLRLHIKSKPIEPRVLNYLFEFYFLFMYILFLLWVLR